MSLASPPTRLAKIAIGDGAMGRDAEFEDASTVSSGAVFLHHLILNINAGFPD
jgi:hypothetical protein